MNKQNKQAVGGWQHDLLQHFQDTLPPDRRVHLAVLVEPYLSMLLLGLKTVESRFATTRRAPWGAVTPGDALLLKRSSGPVVATAELANVWSVEIQSPNQLNSIRSRFGKRICAPDSFWTDHARARYATLMEIARVSPVKSINCDKRDQRGWVVLRDPAQTLCG